MLDVLAGNGLVGLVGRHDGSDLAGGDPVEGQRVLLVIGGRLEDDVLHDVGIILRRARAPSEPRRRAWGLLRAADPDLWQLRGSFLEEVLQVDEELGLLRARLEALGNGEHNGSAGHPTPANER
jgi:hypothetical protein